MKKNFFTPLFCLIVSITLGTLFSCNREDFNDFPNNGTVNADGYLQITFDLPEFQTPAKPNTRAMDQTLESAIDKEKLHIFVFKADASDNTFLYEAPVLSYQEDQAKQQATVTIKMVKDVASDLVVVANYEDLPAIDKSKTKAQFYKECVFSMPTDNDNKWKTIVHIPMAGTIGDVMAKEREITVGGTKSEVNIAMRRAMARIDVGINFESTSEGKLAKTATGLGHFKLGEINIVHTYDQGLIGSLDPTVAQIPQGATRRGSDNPLKFTVPTGSENSFVREIYVPQAKAPQAKAVAPSDIHCVIVGGYYGGSSEMSYYRMDFADIDEQTKTPEYLDILGNYRYVFNITGVNGPGFSTYEQALKSSPVLPGESIEYSLIKWDESIHEMHVQGKYYFGLDNREVTLKAKNITDEPDNFKVIKYQTNYPISQADGISFVWENPVDPANPSVSPFFEAQWTKEGEKGEITITPKTTNETNTVLTDILHVKLDGFTIKVIVNQEYINFKYTLNCETVKVFGTYRPGSTLDPDKHYITLDITAEDATINDTQFIIETEEINGIKFYAEGTFDVTESKLTMTGITLKGSGTLNKEVKTDPFTVTIISNSSSGSYCEATINPVIARLKILTIGTNLYDVAPTSKAYKVLTTPSNFGPDDNSLVKIEGFTFVAPGTEVSKTAEALLTKSGGELADIVVLGHAAKVDATNKKLFADYLKKGGVIVAFLEDPTLYAGHLLTAIFPSCNVSWANPAYGGGTVYPLPGNSVYKSTYVDPTADGSKPWEVYFAELQKDPVLFGPFGDIRDKQWGEDASSTTWVSGIPTDHLTVYSTSGNLSDNNVNAHPNKITGFRYQSEDINMVWFGDGGFLSGLSSGTTAYPFQIINENNFPRPAEEYGRGSRKYDVYNSQIFSNAMVWAIDRSVELLDKRDAASSN